MNKENHTKILGFKRAELNPRNNQKRKQPSRKNRPKKVGVSNG